MKSDARRGYSPVLIAMVEKADPESVVTRFAKHCIANNISVAEVAQRFRVTRASVYSWFKYESQPRERYIELMTVFLARHAPPPA
jgi:DNA invertase Pin-like site-specific DNA recombinase